MPFSKRAFIVVTFVLMFSIFLANITNIISVNIDNIKDEQMQHSKKSQHDQSLRNVPSNFIGNASQNLMWFLQISDIHISIFHDPSRVSELKEFCDLTVKTIMPSVVLASGDLTDAKTSDNMGSRQYIDEWELYKDVLEESNVLKHTVWLDIRGNHDNFNVPSLKSKENFYRNYSIQGPKHLKSYIYQIKKGDEAYSFIGMDACLEPGPRRPFNFVGVLTQQEMEHLRSLVVEGRKGGSTRNYLVWFGHYPTSCILSPNPGIRALISSIPEGLVYLCGHFHMLGGLVPDMYTLQHGGFLELELGDWKDNRIYRLAAIDHGFFSFVDIPHREWPAVLITNPKHALYAIPSRESLEQISLSTHIRLLAFSLSTIKKVEARIDGNEWESCAHVEGPLFTLRWDPVQFSRGVHTLEVLVEDEDGREKVVEQPFSLDGTRLSFKLLSRIALMGNVSMVFQFLFGASLVLYIVPLCMLRCLDKLTKVKKIQKPIIGIRCFRRWTRRLWILAATDRIFYPLVVYPLYLTVGPWSVGEIIEGHVGVIFAWGTIVNGAYLPGSFTYAYGFLQMFSFQIPLTIFLANRVDKRLEEKTRSSQRSLSCRACYHLPFTILVILQIIFAYFFWLAYGTMAFILGPLRTWSVILALVLWYQANAMPQKILQNAALVWDGNLNCIRSNDENECATCVEPSS